MLVLEHSNVEYCSGWRISKTLTNAEVAATEDGRIPGLLAYQPPQNRPNPSGIGRGRRPSTAGQRPAVTKVAAPPAFQQAGAIIPSVNQKRGKLLIKYRPIAASFHWVNPSKIAKATTLLPDQ